MNPAFAALGDGLRASLLLKPRGNPLLPGPGAFVLAVVVYLAVQAIASGIDTPPPRMISGWGVSQVLADALLTLVAAWVLVRLAGRSGIVWAASAIALAATASTSLIVHWPLREIALMLFDRGHHVLSAVVLWLSMAWWFLVLVRLASWMMPLRLPRAWLATVLAYAVSAMPWWWLPVAPMIAQDEARAQAELNAAGVDADLIVDSGFERGATPDFDPERLMFDQPYRIGEAIDALQPRVPGKTNLYVVAFAGDGSEDVFRNEVEYVEQLFSQRFEAAGRIIVLENNPASVNQRPLATVTNLQIALDAIASRMDPAEDILLVYLTTHGSSEHELYVALDPLPLNQIRPEDLADVLDTSPSMRWKVLIVNACYSGGFIDALRDDSTLVITAARSDRTSFGCGTESEITYFGKAFLAEALNETTSIPEAFEQASRRVAEWEQQEQGEERSEPQIATSRSIEAKLQQWRLGLPDAPPVEFAPAAAVDAGPGPSP